MTTTPSIRFALGLGALFAAGTALADEVRVDVVVDFNRAGYQVARPTADKPAFYFPVPLGYAEVGEPIAFQRPPPPADQVEHFLAEALYAQGYRLASRASPPSLVFVIRWGYMAPNLKRDDEELAQIRQNPLEAGDFGPDRGGATMMEASLERSTLALPQYAQGETDQMLSLVAGDTLRDRHINVHLNSSPVMERFLEMARTPRYFIWLSAYDFKDWMEHYQAWHEHKGATGRNQRPKLLWEAHVSTELAGHTLEEVLPALINTAAPMFGRETRFPQLVMAPAVPLGHVEVGQPVLKGN
jgi:hypothetical protein